MGNPSDGYHGKTISMSIANFWAEVSIKESEKLVSQSFSPLKVKLTFASANLNSPRLYCYSFLSLCFHLSGVEVP